MKKITQKNIKMETYIIDDENDTQKNLTKEELITYINTENEINKELALKDLYCAGCLFSFWIDNDINVKSEQIISIHEEISVKDFYEFENCAIYRLGNNRILLLNSNERASDEIIEFFGYKSAKLLCTCDTYLFAIDEDNTTYYYNSSRDERFLTQISSIVSQNVEKIVKIKCSMNYFCFLREDSSCCFMYNNFSRVKFYSFENVEDIYSNDYFIVIKQKNGIFKYFHNNSFINLPEQTYKIELNQKHIIALFTNGGMASFPKNTEFLSAIQDRIISISSHKNNIFFINDQGVIKNIDMKSKNIKDISDGSIFFEKVLCMGNKCVALEKDEIYIFNEHGRYKRIFKDEYTEENFTQNEKYLQVAHILEKNNVIDMFYMSDYLLVKTEIYQSLVLNKKQLDDFFLQII